MRARLLRLPCPRFSNALARLAPALVAGVCLTAGLAATPALAQAPTQLRNEIVSSDNAAQYSGEIEAFLQAKLNTLAGEDLSAASEAREDVITTLANPINSRSFRNEASRQLQQLLPRLLSDSRFFTRLNAAIILEDIARRTGNTTLTRVVLDAMDDESAGVVLWGVKSVEPLLGEALSRQGANDPLVPAMLQAAQRFPDNGQLAEEAYRSMMLRLSGGNAVAGNVLDAAIPVVVPAALDLMESRVAQYNPGAIETPATPLAEIDGLLLVSHPATWGRIDQMEGGKTRIAKTLRDLLDLTLATQLAAIDAGEDGMRNELGRLLQRLGSSWQAVAALDAGNANAAAVGQAAKAVKDLPVRMAPQLLETQVEELLDAIEVAYPEIGPRPTAGGAGGSAADDGADEGDGDGGDE